MLCAATPSAVLERIQKIARAYGLTDTVKNHKQEKIHLISRERRGRFLRSLAVS